MATPQGCTHLKLRQLGRALTRHYEGFVTPSGLKITQYSLLSTVVAHGPMAAGALATALRMDASTLSRNLQPLVTQGWLELARGEDARSRIVQATDAGRAQRTLGQRAWKRAQLALNARLGAERIAALHELVDDCLLQLDGGELGTS